METKKTIRLRIFLWDQFIRPFYVFGELNFIKMFLLGLLLVFMIIAAPVISVYIVALLLMIMFTIELVKYYKSGEFMRNYRKYKYPDYKRATKVLKREDKDD